MGGFLQAGVNGHITSVIPQAQEQILLHVFNAAHAKPWNRASSPRVSPTDIPAAAAAAAGSIPTLG